MPAPCFFVYGFEFNGYLATADVKRKQWMITASERRWSVEYRIVQQFFQRVKMVYLSMLFLFLI